MRFPFLIVLMLILSASALSQIKPKTSKTKNSDKDIEYNNRMKTEIQKAENALTDIKILGRHSAADIVLIPDGMPPVSLVRKIQTAFGNKHMLFKISVLSSSAKVLNPDGKQTINRM